MTLAVLWPYILSAGGVLGIYIAGRKNMWGWALGLGMQVLWVAFAITTGQYGFLISAAAYGWVYALNLKKWYDESHPKESGGIIDEGVIQEGHITEEWFT